MDIFFLIDIVVNLNSGVRISGEYIHNRRKITWIYLTGATLLSTSSFCMLMTADGRIHTWQSFSQHDLHGSHSVSTIYMAVIPNNVTVTSARFTWQSFSQRLYYSIQRVCCKSCYTSSVILRVSCKYCCTSSVLIVLYNSANNRPVLV